MDTAVVVIWFLRVVAMNMDIPDASLICQFQFPPPVLSKTQEDHTVTRAPHHHPHFRHSGKKSSMYELGSVIRWSWLSWKQSKSNSHVPRSLQFQGMFLPRIPCGKEPMSTKGRNTQPCLEWLASRQPTARSTPPWLTTVGWSCTWQVRKQLSAKAGQVQGWWVHSSGRWIYVTTS